MPKLGRKTPCAECPWLRKSARGYLGASHAEEFYRASIPQEQNMPCHMSIDYGDPDWRETQLPDADLCAGNLIFYINNCKMPRRTELAQAVRQVKASPHVFSWAIEFIKHHLPMTSDPEEICAINQRAQWPYAPDVE